ncbi:peptidoglycan-binding protein [Euzebya tangerina]|uniref:peptidoglycan-binding protein n=1 Tax=Euzebya tangerina TaxID=591198 RepID=UPI000E321729|nr:peptidoglycan-binding protein [Euzebya tangerina]
MDRHFPTICVVLTILLVMAVMPAAYAVSDINDTVEITFPVAGPNRYSDDYQQIRGGGSRRHQATDIYGVKGQAIHAAASGRVCMAPGINEPMPAYGYIIRICTGNVVYGYHHLNNDSPGTDDGAGGYRNAYAPGIQVGATVREGQLIGYMGDSGNAEDTPVHLHFSIFDQDLVDPEIAESPWRQHYLNPYNSLVAAERAGRVPSSTSGALKTGASGSSVADWQADLNTAIDAGLATDGAFGPATEAATREFQQQEGLTVDGIVGPASRAAMERRLDELGQEPSNKPPGSSSSTGFPGRALRLEDPMLQGQDVRAWQQRMAERGWRGADGAPLAVDGFFGPDSQRAARLFQEEKGLTVDGIVGPATWAEAFS